MPEVTLNTGRVVQTGLIHAPGRMAAARPYRPQFAPPAQALNTGRTELRMNGNNQYGTCVSAYLGNWLDVADGCDILDEVVIAWARKHGGLNGANIDEFIGLLKRDPMVDTAGKPHLVKNHYAINWDNLTDVQNAIAQFKGCDLAVDSSVLSGVVGNSTGWVLTGLRKQHRRYDHSVGHLDYAQAQVLADYYVKMGRVDNINLGNLDSEAMCFGLYTWDTLGLVEAASAPYFTGEAWAVESAQPVPSPEPNPDPGPGPDPGPLPPPPPIPPNPDPPICDCNEILKHLVAAGRLMTRGIDRIVKEQRR